jgi:hypothetical protein
MISIRLNGLFIALVLVASFIVSSCGDRSIQQVVQAAFKEMPTNWEGFQGLFASNASIKWCMEGSTVCKQGSFDSIFSDFRHNVRLILVGDTRLGGEFASDMLHHFTYFIETFAGCSTTWSGYAMYEFNRKGEVEWMRIFSENSMAVLSCISQGNRTVSS